MVNMTKKAFIIIADLLLDNIYAAVDRLEKSCDNFNKRKFYNYIIQSLLDKC